jgi:signal peptidase II
VRNSGVAFSMFNDFAPLIVIVSVVTVAFCVVALFALLLGKIRDRMGRLSVAMLLGGAAGNVIDRIMDGSVVDMFELQFMRFAIFNVADLFVTLGGLLFCLFIIRASLSARGADKSETKTKAKTSAASASAARENPPLAEAAAEDYTLERILSEYRLADAQSAGAASDTEAADDADNPRS